MTKRVDAAGRPMCHNGLHYLDLPGAIYERKDKPGIKACAACKRERSRRADARRRLRKTVAKAQAEAKVRNKIEAEQKAKDESEQRARAKMQYVVRSGASRQERALFRHAQMIRRSRGLL